MVYYAVIDTNVFISALLSKRADAATVRVLDAMFEGKIVPLYHTDILTEYDEVLHRSKFHFKEETIQLVINAVKQYGVEVFPQPTGEILIDMDDLIFYKRIAKGVWKCEIAGGAAIRGGKSRKQPGSIGRKGSIMHISERI